MNGERLTIRGRVQGVGFRPTVWRIARELGLSGDVRNTSDGVVVRMWGEGRRGFLNRLRSELPVLARIEDVRADPLVEAAPAGFTILPSQVGEVPAEITPDVSTCESCLQEIRDPFSRRYRYPFTNCTDCGPRFSIVDGAPYDRERTRMRSFEMCSACRAEFEDPENRRFHAQPNACHGCGPRAWIEKLGPGTVNSEQFSMLDDVDAAGGAILNGFIVAIKGIGGFHIACDATSDSVVTRLRDRKCRDAKPFALMARSLDIIARYVRMSDIEAEQLSSPVAPIVLLEAKENLLPSSIAPGLDRLGFMLPATPLHHLLFNRIDRPVIFTSGNRADEPPCLSNEDCRERLASIADFALMHDREIANRADDSVIRVVEGIPRSVRRARGYAPGSLPLPSGFSSDIPVLAYGGDLKNTFALIADGRAIVSPHLGDARDPATILDMEHQLKLFTKLYGVEPVLTAVDLHPDYIPGRKMRDACTNGLTVGVQHHHAHIASVLGENGRSYSAPPVLGIALDGTGYGSDGSVWGGEFLLADYRNSERLGCFKPVALIGGDAASQEPWRNAYAHLLAEMSWQELEMNFSQSPIFKRLAKLPKSAMDSMLRSDTNVPVSTSCGRLFDAASAIVGLAWDRQQFEGEAAMRFEACLDRSALKEPENLAYPFSLPLLNGTGIPYLEPISVWRAILGDLILDTPVGIISARFHRGLAMGIVALAKTIRRKTGVSIVALSGGCFQNEILFSLVSDGLRDGDFTVLSHSQIPSNDGGIALGQALVALARKMGKKEEKNVSRNSRTNHSHR